MTKKSTPGDGYRDSDPTSARAASADALGHGLTIAVSIGIFMWAGSKADAWLGTDPWLTLLGLFVGAAAGFYRLYAHMVLAPREDRSERGPGDEE